MPFPGHLGTADIQAIEKTAVDSGAVTFDRELTSRGIPRGFFYGLKKNPSDLVQFQLDLNAYNMVERLTDGRNPMVLFLHSVASQLRLRNQNSEAAAIEKIANKVSNHSQGVKDLPDPKSLPEVARQEAIIGRNDMVDFDFLRRGRTVGNSVARLQVPRFEGGNLRTLDGARPWIMSGTGWMISPQILITNHHVINARQADEPAASDSDFQKQASETLVEFDFDSAAAAKKIVNALSLLHASVTLDYALLRMPENLGRAPLPLEENAIVMSAATYMALNIIQHPRGDSKQIAFRNNLLTATNATDIRYFTDTDYGSSGSPVCDDSWRVVGLHRGAKHANNVRYQGKETAYVNFGSQLSAILADLTQANKGLHDEIADAQSA